MAGVWVIVNPSPYGKKKKGHGWWKAWASENILPVWFLFFLGKTCFTCLVNQKERNCVYKVGWLGESLLPDPNDCKGTSKAHYKHVG